MHPNFKQAAMKRKLPPKAALFPSAGKPSQSSTKKRPRSIVPISLRCSPAWPDYEPVAKLAKAIPGCRRVWRAGDGCNLGLKWHTAVQHCAVYEFALTHQWRDQLNAFVNGKEKTTCWQEVHRPVGKDCAIVFVTRRGRAVWVSVAHAETFDQCGVSPLMHESVFFNTVKVSGGWAVDTDVPPVFPEDFMLSMCQPAAGVQDGNFQIITVRCPHPGWVCNALFVTVTTADGASKHTVDRIVRGGQTPWGYATTGLYLSTPVPHAAQKRQDVSVAPCAFPPALHMSVSSCARMTALTGVVWKPVPKTGSARDICNRMDFSYSTAQFITTQKAHSETMRQLSDVAQGSAQETRAAKLSARKLLRANEREYKTAGGTWERVAYATVRDLLDCQTASPLAAKLVARCSQQSIGPGVFGRTYAFITTIEGLPVVVIDTDTLCLSDYTCLWNQITAAFKEQSWPSVEADDAALQILGSKAQAGSHHLAASIRGKLAPCVQAVLPGGWAHAEATKGKPDTFDRMKQVERWTTASVLNKCHRSLTDIENLLGASLTGATQQPHSRAAKTHFAAVFNRKKTQIKSCYTLAADSTFRLCDNASQCSAVQATDGTPNTPLSVTIAYDA